MLYSGDIGLYLSGAQVPIQGCGIFITPPTIKAITQYGETDFLAGVRMFSGDRSFIEPIKLTMPEMENMQDFQIILTVLNADERVRDTAVRFFELICPDYKVEVTSRSLNFSIEGEDGIRGMLNAFNAQTFMRTLKELFWPPERDEQAFNPANKKAEEIARKLEAARRRNAQQTSGGDKASIFGVYTSVLSVGLALDINVIYKYTPFQLYDCFNRYLKKTEYDLYLKIKTTPLMSTDKMEEKEHWAVNLYTMED